MTMKKIAEKLKNEENKMMSTTAADDDDDDLKGMFFLHCDVN